MNNSVQTINIINLTIAFLPIIVIIVIFIKWSLDLKNVVYAIIRMLIQLLLIGYFLTYIFESNSSLIIVISLIIMLFSSSWIALGTIKNRRIILYKNAILSIAIGGIPTLLCITQGVLKLEPWYYPRYLIPLAGMIFANSMNSVSLAAERLDAEIKRDVAYEKARKIAFQASLIPIINSLFAVGLVSIPGMMTGQILSNISPLIAARYQIMVMCMIFGSAGISSACFLTLVKLDFSEKQV